MMMGKYSISISVCITLENLLVLLSIKCMNEAHIASIVDSLNGKHSQVMTQLMHYEQKAVKHRDCCLSSFTF